MTSLNASTVNQVENNVFFKKVTDNILFTSQFGQFHAGITTINERPYVTVSKYYLPPKSDEWHPTHCTVNLPPEAWAELVSLVPTIANDLAQVSRMVKLLFIISVVAFPTLFTI